MKTPPKEQSEQETIARRDAALFRALNTPHKPHKPLKAKVDKSPAKRKKGDGPIVKNRRPKEA